MISVFEIGRWYPAPAPGLPGESDAAYTDRITGASGGPTPYDHKRYRECGMGYHWSGSCTRSKSHECACPCHTDPGVTAEQILSMSPGQTEAACTLTDLYDLVEATGTRIVYAISQGVADGTVIDLASIAERLATEYGSTITEYFAIDVVSVMDRFCGTALGIRR